VRILILVGLVTAAASFVAQVPITPSNESSPATVEEFLARATSILQEAGVPGAAISLVRSDGIEWEGGLGVADRDRGTPVTADTHFRVGSISKTFVAMSLVQLSEDGLVDLNATIDEIAPEVPIDNPWHADAPVRVIHILQHTAGFDDMHFNERYTNGPDLPLLEVLRLNPSSRRVRWKPGTRMSYSNPGYAVAGYLIEKITEKPYSDYIRQEIFAPLGMNTSSFDLTPDDQPLLATGYGGPDGAPVGYPGIYLRPAGNMHSSAHEMGLFVRMLLNWGELGTAFVIDPEYLGNMEQPRTTLASSAGLRNGYGTGIVTRLNLPYRMLGHNGAIDGFYSTYAYSPSRDVGYVVLVNSTGPSVAAATERVAALALRYLKREIEPPSKPVGVVGPATLDRYLGYYHDANPRNQVFWGFQWLLAGRTIARVGDTLVERPLFGETLPLIPVSDSLFRRENELDASRVFTTDEGGTMVLTGADIYAERMPRWRVELVRVSLAVAVVVVLSVFLVAMVWIARIRRATPRGFWPLKLVLFLCPIALIAPVAALAFTPPQGWGEQNVGTSVVAVATLALPTLAMIAAALTIGAQRQHASRLLVAYAIAMIGAVAGISGYLGASDLLGIRLWAY
jgi:CubicO group peptidase (beta-lactamase class C family)